MKKEIHNAKTNEKGELRKKRDYGGKGQGAREGRWAKPEQSL